MKEWTHISMMIWVGASQHGLLDHLGAQLHAHASCTQNGTVGIWDYHILASSASQLLRLHYVCPLAFSHVAIFKSQ